LKPLSAALPAMPSFAGLKAPPSVSSNSPRHGSTAVAGLMNFKPTALANLPAVQVDRAVMHSLPPSLKWANKLSKDFDLLAWKVEGTLEDLRTAESSLTAMLEPLSPDIVARGIAELIALTAPPKDTDPKIMAIAYQKRLAEYPADAVIYALREWPNQSKWFPAWAELRDMLEYRTHDRKLRLQAVRNAMKG
jgi:hypothetical protein